MLPESHPSSSLRAAAERLVRSLVDDGGPKMVVLSDDREILAHAGRADFDAAALAAVGAACARGTAVDDGALSAAVGDDDLYAHALSVGRRTVFLTSVGARVPRIRDVERALLLA